MGIFFFLKERKLRGGGGYNLGTSFCTLVLSLPTVLRFYSKFCNNIFFPQKPTISTHITSPLELFFIKKLHLFFFFFFFRFFIKVCYVCKDNTSDPLLGTLIQGEERAEFCRAL